MNAGAGACPAHTIFDLLDKEHRGHTLYQFLVAMSLRYHGFENQHLLCLPPNIWDERSISIVLSPKYNIQLLGGLVVRDFECLAVCL